MFRVTIFRNGTISRIEFNRLNDNTTIGELPKLLKMFFPKLDMYLYFPPETQRRLQSLNYTLNATFNATENQTIDQYSLQ